MTITAAMRLAVRRRAGYACEYCSVTESDAGGELTIDHTRPRAHEGTDHIDSLVYCCSRCNLYKADYYSAPSTDPVLWNPRTDAATLHFLVLADGTLHPKTATGAFAIRRLRLNRPELVAYRLRRREHAEQTRLLSYYRELQRDLGQLYRQQAILLDEQRALLAEQQALLRLLLEEQ
jgi:hypothetical protein